MPSRFSEVIRDHQQLKSTIAQIEEMKNRIKRNERQMFPPQSFALRSGAEAIGPTDFGEGTRAGDLAQQLDIITSLNALLQSVVSNYLSPFQSLQFWSAISPIIPNNSANVSSYIDELTNIFNYLQTESAFKPTDTGAISSLLRRIIQTAERSANPAQPIVVNNFQNISQVQNIMNNPDGSNNNQPPPPAVQQFVAETSSSSGSDDVDIFAQAPGSTLPTVAEEPSTPAPTDVGYAETPASTYGTPKLDLTGEATGMEFGSPQPAVSLDTPSPYRPVTERITEVKKSASKVIKAAEKDIGYIKEIEEALKITAAKAFPHLEKTNAINISAYVVVGVQKDKDIFWLLDDYSAATPTAREQILREYNARATNAVRLFMTYQREYFEALAREATPGKTPAKLFGRLAEQDTAHPRFIHFLMNDAEGPEYMSPTEILGFIYDSTMPEEDESGLVVEEEAGITPPATPRLEENIRQIQYASPEKISEKIYDRTPPPRFSELSQADTPSRRDVIAQVLAETSPEPPAAQGRPVRNRNPRGTYNPVTGRDQFGNGLKPVSAGRRTIKSAMNKVNDLYSAVEKGNKSQSTKNQIKSNLEFLVKKGKVSETYLKNVMNKLAKL